MKLRIKSTAALALSVAAFVPAAAAPVFSDDFNRADANVVGNGWSETEPQPGDIRIHDGVLELQDAGSRILQASGLSTVGFTAITLGYDWARAGNTEVPDELAVEWRDGSQAVEAWNLLALHSLAGTATTFTQEWFALGSAAENLADLEFRFRLSVNANNEGILLDNIVLAGTSSTAAPGSQQVPEPGSAALAGLSLVLLALTRRGKQRG
jgi:hypothetical protein